MQILVPAQGPESWRALLADPSKHWKVGYSARTIAHCWHAQAHFPQEIREVFGRSAELSSVTPLLAIPEHKVAIPGRGFPTQMDVWVLGRTNEGLISIGVEGKVAEPFGQTVGEWNQAGGTNKQARLSALAELLGIAEPVPDDVRYQLIHRTTGSVVEAKRFNASKAAMIVHAFDSPAESLNAFFRFAEVFGAEPRRNQLLSVGQRSGVDLYLAWIDGEDRYRGI